MARHFEMKTDDRPLKYIQTHGHGIRKPAQVEERLELKVPPVCRREERGKNRKLQQMNYQTTHSITIPISTRYALSHTAKPPERLGY